MISNDHSNKPLYCFIALSGGELTQIVPLLNKIFDLRPEKIIEHLDLIKPIYRKIAAYGHFGRGDDYRWERTDKKDELANYL